MMANLISTQELAAKLTEHHHLIPPIGKAKWSSRRKKKRGIAAVFIIDMFPSPPLLLLSTAVRLISRVTPLEFFFYTLYAESPRMCSR